MKTSSEKLLQAIQNLKCPKHDAKVSCVVLDKSGNNNHKFCCIQCILMDPRFFEKNKDRIMELPKFFEELGYDQKVSIPEDILNQSKSATEVKNQ